MLNRKGYGGYEYIMGVMRWFVCMVPWCGGFGWIDWVDGVVGVCVWLVGVDNPIGCMVWCVGVVCWGGERWKYACKRRCFRLLILVLPVENHMLPIKDLMVDGGCIATIGGSRLFCYKYYLYNYIIKLNMWFFYAVSFLKIWLNSIGVWMMAKLKHGLHENKQNISLLATRIYN
jgi:hypothetical protein